MENIVLQTECSELEHGKKYQGEFLLDEVKINFEVDIDGELPPAEALATGCALDVNLAVDVHFGKEEIGDLDNFVQGELGELLFKSAWDAVLGHYRLASGSISGVIAEMVTDPDKERYLREHLDPERETQILKEFGGVIKSRLENQWIPRTPDLDTLMDKASR